ncbi:hypothetical protein EV121DRAFT_293526 [Schizophyllum commune]
MRRCSRLVDERDVLYFRTLRPRGRWCERLQRWAHDLIQDPGVTSKEVQSISDTHKAELRTGSVDVLVPTSLAASPVPPRMHMKTRPESLPATRGLQAQLLRQLDPERQQRLHTKDHASRTLNCSDELDACRDGVIAYMETTLMNAYYRDIVDGVELKMLCQDWTIAGYSIWGGTTRYNFAHAPKGTEAVVVQCKISRSAAQRWSRMRIALAQRYSTQVCADTKYQGAHVLVHIEQLFLSIWLFIMLSYYILDFKEL